MERFAIIYKVASRHHQPPRLRLLVKGAIYLAAQPPRLEKAGSSAPSMHFQFIHSFPVCASKERGYLFDGAATPPS
jgi:hypothetical protein